MKKKSEKKLVLGKIKIASLSDPNKQRIVGGKPPETAPIICDPISIRKALCKSKAC